MAEIKWFSNEKLRLAYIRGQYSEYKPKVADTKKKSTKKTKEVTE